MPEVPYITPRSGRFLIALLFVIKVGLLVWNAKVFDSKPYDVGHHSDRALFGGLRPGKMAYNPPPYYFPALLAKRPADVPMVERSSETIGEDEEAVQSRQERATPATRAEKRFRNELIALLRYTNIFWVGLFYVCWIYVSFPRILRGFQPWFLASLLLLVLPGYQKLGVMTHPDNMFAGMAAAAISVWLWLRERWQASQRSAAVPEVAPAPADPAEANAGSESVVQAEAVAVASASALETERDNDASDSDAPDSDASDNDDSDAPDSDAPAAPSPAAAASSAATPAGITFLHLLGFAFVIGLMALTRPFAAVPTAVLSGLCALYALRSVGHRVTKALPRVLVLGTIVAVMSLSWYVYRWKMSGAVTNAYRTGYIARFEKRRANFDYFAYYTSLNLKDLIVDPSRKMGDGNSGVYADTPLANSFFTLLYSEIWGDQWLYFSGPRMRDNKVWSKRMLLTGALPVPPIMFGLGALSLWGLGRQLLRRLKETSSTAFFTRLGLLVEEFEVPATLLSIALVGAALFVYWQGGPALLPGKNSTVKFIYIATLFPPAIALVFLRRVKPTTFNLLSGYFLLLFVVAYPVAAYWPAN